MPNIRVTCPACRTQLEIDGQYDGQEVECGSCLQVFVAHAAVPKPPAIRGVVRPAAPKRSAPPPTRKPDPDDDYPHDRYDDDYTEPRTANGLGIAARVLGVLAVISFCCWPVSGLLSALAVVLGLIGRNNPADRPSANAGLILGVVGAVLNVGFVAWAGGVNWAPGFWR